MRGRHSFGHGFDLQAWYMIHDTWYMIHDEHDDDELLNMLNMFNLYADVDARSMTPSRNTRSYTLRSVPSSPGRSFLAPKELYTWWWPKGYIYSHFLRTHRSLTTTLSINATMTLVSMMACNVKWHEMSNDMKCKMTWNVKWHEMSNTRYMIHDTWYMIHDTWYLIHDTWYMVHDLSLIHIWRCRRRG